MVMNVDSATSRGKSCGKLRGSIVDHSLPTVSEQGGREGGEDLEPIRPSTGSPTVGGGIASTACARPPFRSAKHRSSSFGMATAPVVLEPSQLDQQRAQLNELRARRDALQGKLAAARLERLCRGAGRKESNEASEHKRGHCRNDELQINSQIIGKPRANRT